MGTPTAGGGYVRQRLFSQGYSSEDLEEDACSSSPAAAPEISLPAMERARTWAEVGENLVWVVSAVFIVYYGDREENMVSLLWADERIRRYEGFLALIIWLNFKFFFTCLLW